MQRHSTAGLVCHRELLYGVLQVHLLLLLLLLLLVLMFLLLLLVLLLGYEILEGVAGGWRGLRAQPSLLKEWLQGWGCRPAQPF